VKSGKAIAANELYALAFGLFLGLCILKFGNPVILDEKILPPANLSEFWHDAWPTHWANWIFFPLAAVGALVWCTSASGAATFSVLGSRPKNKNQARVGVHPLGCSRYLIILPLLWLGWQFVSATRTVDANLTATTLWQFSGCVASFFIGVLIINTPRRFNFLLAGIFVALAICLISAIRQRIEFPQDAKFLLEGQRAGWTNMPPQTVLEMKRDQTIVTTNGVDIVNPMILAKFQKNRVMGTMVYPNALAEIILLLFPIAFVLVLNETQKLRPVVRGAAVAVSVALAAAAFFWSGSKFGWLIAIAIGALYLFRLSWPLKFKITALVLVAVLGIGVFAIRFHHYFANGATSAVARLDYWRAAVQTTASHPALGTGPGTFQRPYAKLKSPDAEMARLAHNDYLEQFSDSGVPAGIFFCGWVAVALTVIARNDWKSQDPVKFALFLGLLGWFIQELGEFGLYIPASAWTAFTLLGIGLSTAGSELKHRTSNAEH
jgi:O-Antigen ligase